MHKRCLKCLSPLTCNSAIDEPLILELFRHLYKAPDVFAKWFEQFKTCDLPKQLAICQQARDAELWLWANNGAFRCHEFTLFSMNFVERLHRVCQRPVEDEYGPEWGAF